MSNKKRQSYLKKKRILAAKPVSMTDFHHRVMARAAKQGKKYCSTRVERNTNNYGEITQQFNAYIEDGNWWTGNSVDQVLKLIDQFFENDKKPLVNEVTVEEPFEL